MHNRLPYRSRNYHDTQFEVNDAFCFRSDAEHESRQADRSRFIERSRVVDRVGDRVRGTRDRLSLMKNNKKKKK